MSGRTGLLNILALLIFPLRTLPQSHAGHLSLPAVISDHMVLQQRSKAVLWGWAGKGSQVNIAPGWTSRKYTAVADSTGKWKLHIPTPRAGGPYTVEFNSEATHISVKDVLIGEVWVCSGQSNMEMPLKGYNKQPVLNAAAIIADAVNHPDIHVFPGTQSSITGTFIRLQRQLEGHRYRYREGFQRSCVSVCKNTA
ncbi:hypothetical protein [Chitinophaga sp. W3I9]|uniref:hypothetical protein n=1 Tax=Chitinophaga sp. W3I9 TaxID=3373924 RepID=UPI003D229E26